jgi:two-component system OmpR family response regulator
MNVLLIEDDERIVEFVRRGLEAEGYRVDVARRGADGIRRVGAGTRVIILDLLLPDIDGREVCRRLRESGVATPILMLTALYTIKDKVHGLRLGADDYLTKPFAFSELVARVQALGRRGGSYRPDQTALQAGDLVLDRETHEVRRGERLIVLTPREFSLLACLIAASGTVVSRSEILAQVWGSSEHPLTNVVDVYVRQLRRKLDQGGSPPLIQTVRGFGYKIRTA